MRILYIDTTTSYLYTGLVVDNKLLAEVKENCGKDLSSVALDKISQMLLENNLTPNDIDKIIVVNGPGSFTGIRVGVTIAKTFAYSLNKQITTISSLEAMALSVDIESDFIIPIIDARHGYVYGAIFDKENHSVLKQQYIKLAALKCAVDNLIGEFVYVSNDSFESIDVEGYSPNILKIVNTFCDKESVNPHAVDPIYLKLTEAEEKQNFEII